MNMNQKGFVNIILIIVIAVLLGVVGYFAFIKKPESITQQSTPNSVSSNTQNQTTESVNKTFSESEILVSLKTNWQSVQVLIPFRPTYHNQTENSAKIWRTPTAIQFIGKNNVLVKFEDDNNAHVAAFHFSDSKFNLLEVFENQTEFTLSGWQNLVNKYGDSSYSVGTYAIDLIRNKQIVSFPELTKVSENIFVKNYWEN